MSGISKYFKCACPQQSALHKMGNVTFFNTTTPFIQTNSPSDPNFPRYKDYSGT